MVVEYSLARPCLLLHQKFIYLEWVVKVKSSSWHSILLSQRHWCLVPAADQSPSDKVTRRAFLYTVRP